jgi:hypothetical protein
MESVPLWRSGDYGMTWKDKGWVFPESHKEFAFPALIEFVKGQSLNKDGYVYGISDNSPYHTAMNRNGARGRGGFQA